MKIPGFKLPSYDILVFDADELLKVGLKFDREELELYESKTGDEIIEEYINLLRKHTKLDTIRAYILRSFIRNKLSCEYKNKIIKLEFDLREKEPNIDDSLCAISVYYDEYDQEQKGWGFSTTRVIEGFWGEW